MNSNDLELRQSKILKVDFLGVLEDFIGGSMERTGRTTWSLNRLALVRVPLYENLPLVYEFTL